MKVIIEQHLTLSVFQFPQTTGIELRIYANAPFITFNGQAFPVGSPNTPNSWYLPVACSIQGGNELNIPSFEIDSTEDSPTDRSATYTAWLFAGDERLGNVPFLTGFSVPQVPAVQTWTDLVLHRDSFNPPPRQGVYDVGVVEYKISEALGLRHMGSINDPGMLALQDPPVDPSFPIALGPNSPGVTRASGLATLVAGTVIVLSSAVSATCGILLTGQADGASGTLWVSAKVNGVSFTITSSNDTDDGVVFWEIVEP